MPTRPKPPCQVKTCTGRQPCPKHPIKRYYDPRHNRRSNERYSNTDYRRARDKAFKRDGHRCRWPGCGATKNLQAHHLRRIEDGGRHHPDNLVTVCPKHHAILEKRARGGVGPTGL